MIVSVEHFSFNIDLDKVKSADDMGSDKNESLFLPSSNNQEQALKQSQGGSKRKNNLKGDHDLISTLNVSLMGSVRPHRLPTYRKRRKSSNFDDSSIEMVHEKTKTPS